VALDEPLQAQTIPFEGLGGAVVLNPLQKRTDDRGLGAGGYGSLLGPGHRFVKPLPGLVLVGTEVLSPSVNLDEPRLTFLPPPRLWFLGDERDFGQVF
jgi:hypothetical protein